MKINLGSGHKRFEGFLNLDDDTLCNPDYLINLEKDLLPFPDNSVDEVKAHHILEHIGDNFIPLIQDIYRVCKHNAIVDIRVPHHLHEFYFADPTHKRPITVQMLSTFSKTNNKRDFESNGSYSGFAFKYNVDFEMIHYDFEYDPFYLEMIQNVKNKKNAGILTPEEEFAYTRLMREATNVATEVVATLKAIKEYKDAEPKLL